MTRYTSTLLLASSLLLSVPALAAPKADKATGTSADKTFVTVNGSAIPLNRAELLALEQKSQGAPDGPELRRSVREILINRELLAQEARRMGMDRHPLLLAQMEMARQGVLIRAYQQEFVRTHPVKDEDVRKEYDELVSRLGKQEYQARHILVAREDEARAIIAKLQSGEDSFANLAKQSQDQGSRDKGGELGWQSAASFVSSFSDAMVKLEKGKFTPNPVRTEFGWHVIQLDDVRPLTPPALDSVKPQIQQNLVQRALERHLQELRQKARISE